MVKPIFIEKIFINEKNKDGQPYMTKPKDGKPARPFKIIVIKSEGKSYSHAAFNESDPCLLLQEQKTETLNITESNGFLNFDMPLTEQDYKRALEFREKLQKQAMNNDKIIADWESSHPKLDEDDFAAESKAKEKSLRDKTIEKQDDLLSEIPF
jgi:hypothetical protein